MNKPFRSSASGLSLAKIVTSDKRFYSKCKEVIVGSSKQAKMYCHFVDIHCELIGYYGFDGSNFTTLFTENILLFESREVFAVIKSVWVKVPLGFLVSQVRKLFVTMIEAARADIHVLGAIASINH